MSDAPGGPPPAHPSFTLCHCTGVRRPAVLAAIAAGCRTVDEVRRATGACSGCSTCYPDLRQLLRDVADGTVVAEPAPPAAGQPPRE
jgi:NAD(P)H-nitrite reductase large subunit